MGGFVDGHFYHCTSCLEYCSSFEFVSKCSSLNRNGHSLLASDNASDTSTVKTDWILGEIQYVISLNFHIV